MRMRRMELLNEQVDRCQQRCQEHTFFFTYMNTFLRSNNFNS